MNHYFNTTQISDSRQLELFSDKNARQEVKILNFMKRYSDKEMSADDLMFNEVLNEGTPLTSYRRSISNLLKEGVIVRCDKMKEGSYGRMVYAYKIK